MVFALIVGEKKVTFNLMNFFQSRPVESYRILVLGESNSGKTQLLNLLTNQRDKLPTWGVNAQVLHYSQNWLEFLEIGGKCEHESSTNPFYRVYDGVIITFDSNYIDTFEKVELYLNRLHIKVPTMVIGTKADQSHSGFFKGIEYSRHPLFFSLQERGIDVLKLSLMEPLQMNIWNQFFDSVCSRKPNIESHIMNIF
jgi:GTPase SAR1 family protein